MSLPPEPDPEADPESDTAGDQVGTEWIAGNPNQCINLYRLRSANDRTTNDANNEGHEYIDPSLIASQT